MGNEEGKDPSRRVSQTTGCFQKALEGSWKGQRGQSSGIESRHQRRDGRPGARGQRDTDTAPPSNPPQLNLGSVLPVSSTLKTHPVVHQLYLNPNMCVCVCVCVCVCTQNPSPTLTSTVPTLIQAASPPISALHVASSLVPGSWPALSTALRSYRNLAKPCQSLCLSYSDPSPAPQSSPVCAPPRLLSSPPPSP